MNNKKFRIKNFTVLLVASCTILFAGDPDRVGTGAGTQTLVPVGARDIAMGGADLATTAGLGALHWNPAGLAAMPDRAAGLFSTMTIFNDIGVNNFAAGLNFGKGTLGLSVKSFDFGDILVTTMEDSDGESGATFSPTFATIGLTYGRRLTDRVNVGFTGKVVYESIARANASAFAFDFGVQYKDFAGLTGLHLGVVARNIATNMTYTGAALLAQSRDKDATYDDFRSREAASDQLASDVEFGISYKYGGNLTFSGVFQNNNFGYDELKFGGEFVFNDMIFLRGGYIQTMEAEVEEVLYGMSFGAGLHYKVAGADLTIDYAHRLSQYFDGNNVFSLRMGF